MQRLGFGLALACSLGLGFSDRAEAQCAEGRQASEATAGRCCWPAQSWNAEAARCEGPPSCPAGRFAEGDTCVPAARAAQSYSGAPAASYGAPGPTFATTTAGYSPEPGQMLTIKSPIEELIITGGLMAITGFAYNVIAGSVLLSGWGNGSPWTLYIPLAGGFIYPAVDGYSYSSTGEVFGIPGAGLQVIGLALMIIGAAAHETSFRPAGAASVTPELVGGPGEAGLGLRWLF
jgi:hypothetical protein